MSPPEHYDDVALEASEAAACAAARDLCRYVLQLKGQQHAASTKHKRDLRLRHALYHLGAMLTHLRLLWHKPDDALNLPRTWRAAYDRGRRSEPEP